ncbi:MAG TPA: serine hydrolase domain-containing protein [Patescibacteria group bacterium]|nr:serine hydrolase domain-containing protein [Patescibacteria group bacterium]
MNKKNVRTILDTWLATKLAYERIPGMVVGIVKDGEVVYKNAFGFADWEKHERMETSHAFFIASISKTFTAIALRQLEISGKLKFSDRVFKYVPWLIDTGSPGKKVTVKQLLSHSSGIWRDGDGDQWSSGKFPSISNIQASLSTNTFTGHAGYKYSNFGFMLLGQVIEAASGMTYNEYVKKHILQPLKMSHTATDLDFCNERIASGYGRDIPGQRRTKFHHTHIGPYSSATGFVSTVDDLAKYCTALLDGRLPFLKLSKPQVTFDSEGLGYGLGFRLKKMGSKILAGHSGGYQGFATRITLDAENRLAVITLTNTNAKAALEVNFGILKLMHAFGKSQKNVSKKFLEYTGLYRSFWSDSQVIALGNNLICFNPKTSSPLKVTERFESFGKDVFIIHTTDPMGDHGERVRFRRNAQGKINAYLQSGLLFQKIS